MNIRCLDSSDAGIYQAIRLRSLQESPRAFLTSYEIENERSMEIVKQRLQPEDGKFTLGCFSDSQELIGTVTFLRETNPKIAHKGNVYAVYVSPEYRGQGVGHALMTELIHRAREIPGLEQINLSVSGSLAAKGLYQSLGFTVFGTERNAMKINGHYEDEDWMVLRLHRNNP